MPQKKIYNNVVDKRLIDNGRIVEDVQAVSPPDIVHPTTTIKGSGMIGEIDMPDITRVNAMEFSVAHNNGVNCRHLLQPGKHSLELRVARQAYETAEAEIELVSVKMRVVGIHKETSQGDIDSGNPQGKTEKYSVLRYEEEIEGEVVTLIDVAANIYKVNGVDYGSQVESILN